MWQAKPFKTVAGLKALILVLDLVYDLTAIYYKTSKSQWELVIGWNGANSVVI